MEALQAGCSGIHDEHVVVLVVHDTEDVAMSANEQFGFYFEYFFEGTGVVFAWETTDVGHQYFDAINVEFEKFGEVVSNVLTVDVAMYGTERGIGAQAVDYVE